jgi:hypothetical protein
LGGDLRAVKGAQNYSPFTGTVDFYRAMSLFRQGTENEARMLAIEAAARMKLLPGMRRTRWRAARPPTT